MLFSQSTRWHDRPCLHDGFTDIPPKALYAGAVEWMASEGIAAGFTDDLFGPDELVTRAQFATFLWRYEGEPPALHSDGFDDVDPGAYYGDAVAWMVQNGITAGRGPRKFDPLSNVSRAQSIVFLHALAGKPEAEARIAFSDVGEDAWFRGALAWGIEKDIVWWTDLDRFGAGLPASRADVALLLHRYHLQTVDPPAQEQGARPQDAGAPEGPAVVP